MLEIFPLEPRAARAILHKMNEVRSIKSRLAKAGPTEEGIAALQVHNLFVFFHTKSIFCAFSYSAS